MRMLVVTALVATILACASTVEAAGDYPSWHQLEPMGYAFEHYVKDANRQYVRGTEEWNRREAIFNAKLAEIKAHNANPSHSWKRGINQFADWTAAEFRNYNKARPELGRESTIQKNIMEPATNPGDLPNSIDYRTRTNPPILTGIKNQGSCGSCWAHAAVETIESFFAIRFGQLPVLSVQQVASCTQSEFGCGGGTYVAGWEWVQHLGGVNEEWTYPYVDFFAPSMEKKYTQTCQNITAKFPKIQNPDGTSFTFTWWPKANVSAWTLVPKNNGHAAMEALALHGPLAISVGSDQWSDYESGILHNNYSTAATNASWQSINHDVQLVGYGFDMDLNQGFWIVRNSWGTNYGEKGYIRLYRPVDGNEPCGDAMGYKICGTSGVLINPGYAEVKPLDRQNGYYF